MSTELMAASHQWATRPADQRFWTLKEMYLEAFAQHNESQDTTVRIDRLGVTVKGDDILLHTPHNGDMNFTHWSFGQFCRNIGAPADYLRGLTETPDLVQRNIEASLRKTAKIQEVVKNPNFQLYHNTESRDALAITRKYHRMPNYKVIQKLMNLDGNWRPSPAMALDPNSPTARPATAEDIAVATNVQLGQMIDKAGLYMSPEDCFIFLVNPDNRISDGSDGGLSRGFFATNSEVGKRGFKLTTFLYRYICQNHIVWGAEDVDVFSRKHVGDNTQTDIFAGIDAALAKYQTRAASADEKIITAAKKEIWTGFDDLADDLAEMGWAGFGKGKIKDAFLLAEKHADTDGSPRSVWGMANGVTRLSQITSYADQRANLDAAAGKMLKQFVSVD
jgi:hypothetical protein